MTHDYKRHGTTTLFAALNVLEGKITGRCMQRHRHQEFIRFLDTVEVQVPQRKAIHAIVDNYATHKHPKVRECRPPSPLDLPLHPNIGVLAQCCGSLRQSHPGAAGMLTSARELGERPRTAARPREATVQELPSDMRAALLELVDVSTGSLRKEVEELAASIRRQMRLVTRVRFCGAIIAAVSGGLTAILQYAAVSAQAVTTAGAVVSMLGGLTTLFADQFEKAPSGIRIASLEEYGKMTEMRGDVERMRMRIERDNLVSIPDDELRAMLERLDGHALQVIRLRLA